MTATTTLVNIASRFEATAAQHPEHLALQTPQGDWTYQRLAERSRAYAGGLAKAGITRGTRAILMVPPGAELFALVFALFRLGAVPVFIDPAMGFKNMGRVIAEAEPEAFVGVSKAHLARLLGGWGKATLKRHVTVGGGPRWGGVRLDKLMDAAAAPPPEPTGPDDPAAILFTSGSTGVPKGALHTHGSFDTQTDFVRDAFAVAPGEVHVATFPVFALYDLALGATAVLPAADLTQPARIDPAVVIESIQRTRATCVFGSPALLDNMGKYGARTGAKLAGVKAVLSASGPVLPPILERLDRMIDPTATITVPYGATEGLPISVIGHREALALAPRWAGGEGLCIGRPLNSVQLVLVPIQDAPIASWPEAGAVARGEVGEIVVKGPIISKSYIARPEDDLRAKIPDPADGGIWHRMGDVGRLDAEGRLWFYGRMAQRVTAPAGPMFTIACEAVFLQHPHVSRAALVGIGPPNRQTPVMCIEPTPGLPRSDWAPLRRDLLEWAARHDHTAAILEVEFFPKFPLDIRHNSKIFREQLTRWVLQGRR